MVGLGPVATEPSLAVKVLSAGSAACVADAITFPLDVAKVRLQIQGEYMSSSMSTLLMTHATAVKYRGVIGTVVTITKQEGFLSLYNGLCAGLQRQMCFASVRIGLYDSVKAKYVEMLGKKYATDKAGQANIAVRILAGISTGGLSVICAQPTDVVKVRMQAQKSNEPRRYNGALHAYKTIGHQEGVAGLWKGTMPNITRNAIVNAAELVCYDCIKEFIIRHNLLSDNMPCHFTSAFVAGFCATVVASPVDVVKTRYMNSPKGRYKGVMHCAVAMYQEGRLKAFYKGFTPSFVRLASWNICMFVTYEQLKRIFTAISQRNVVVIAPSFAKDA